MLSGRRAQCWRHQPAYRRPRHFHAEPELNLVLRGSARLGIGDKQLTLRAGELVIFIPGQDHELLAASSDLELRVVGLKPDLASHLGLAARATGVSTIETADRDSAGETLTALDAVSDAETVERVLIEMVSPWVAQAPRSAAIARRSAALMQQQPELACAELARTLCTSGSELSRRFGRAHGVTLVSYRSRVRLMRFVELVDGGASMTRAALEADFGSYAQCFRVFRDALGCSPRDYFAGVRARIDAASESLEPDTLGCNQ